MKLPRPTSDHDRAALKLGVKRMLSRQFAKQDAAAVVTRVGQQQLSRYANPDCPDEHMPLDVLLDLAIDLQPHPAFALVELCRLAGGAFVPLPTGASEGVWAAEIARAVREGGEAAAVLCEALAAGGTITADEILGGDIIREVSEAIDALCQVRVHLTAVLGAAVGGGKEGA